MTIETQIEYEATLSLGSFLKKLGLKSGGRFTTKIVRIYGDAFEECDGCNHAKQDCTCGDYDDRYSGYEYNDESSFD